MLVSAAMDRPMGTALRQSVLMDTTTITRMLARLTAITDPIGSRAACSSEQGRGSTVMVGATTGAGFMAADTAEDITVGGATTAVEATTVGVVTTAAAVTGGRGLRDPVEGHLITAESRAEDSWAAAAVVLREAEAASTVAVGPTVDTDKLN